jgi:SAM-dependent methyltransferase
LPSHEEIYLRHAPKYDELIAREDYQGNILRTIQDLLPVAGLDVLDLGAGTGRLARLLQPLAARVMALDLSAPMLQLARRGLLRDGSHRSLVAVADHRRVPLGTSTADLIVSGWSVSYVATWNPRSWQVELDTWLQEARRLLRPAGSIILFESLGTGAERPQRLPHLENFYDWLDAQSFARRWIRTDYRFGSKAEAQELAGFFFGTDMLASIVEGPPAILPECTGVWWKSF